MSNKKVFIEPEKQDILTEQECDLINLLRTFNPTQQDILHQMLYKDLFAIAMEKGKVSAGKK